mmetsp:Transcript_54820/g.63278  ORF Transcript_54820/g.63278 Transcript_54820/m.63278 type:complete len:125 (+) Transcript_54820:283-657(+)
MWLSLLIVPAGGAGGGPMLIFVVTTNGGICVCHTQWDQDATLTIGWSNSEQNTRLLSMNDYTPTTPFTLLVNVIISLFPAQSRGQRWCSVMTSSSIMINSWNQYCEWESFRLEWCVLHFDVMAS